MLTEKIVFKPGESVRIRIQDQNFVGALRAFVKQQYDDVEVNDD